MRVGGNTSWGEVTCLESGKVYPNPSAAAKILGFGYGDGIRRSILSGKAYYDLHFVLGHLTGKELEAARHEMEMQARKRLSEGVPDGYEIGIPVKIIKPGLIDCMPVPARGVITSVDIDARHPLTVRTKSGLVYYLKLEEVQLA